MKSISDIRKDNLIFVIERYYDGKQKNLATVLGCAPNVISRYLSPSELKSHRDLSDPIARKIEYLTKLPKYYMDKDHLNIPAEQIADELARSPTNIGKVLGDNITTFMLIDGFKSQAQLSVKSGLGQATINRIIKNESSATVDSVAAIADALGRKPYELLMSKEDDDILHYDHKKLAALPWNEKEKIQDFIEFIISKNEK
ncbi:MAG: helix-turn-helix transcriptional regulator [Providencia heimbachae]|nr:helix-turn-helix transcriptional regulator [Providencia heimbachae]